MTTADPRPWDGWSDMNVFDAIFSPRATRIYRPEPLDPRVLTKILRAATFAASAGNTQPWEFLVVTDAGLKAALQERLAAAFADIDAQRAQEPDKLRDGAGRSITGHDAVDNINNVAAIVMVLWNPDRGIRFRGEYETNADGTLREARRSIGGRGSSLYPACQNMILAAQALGVQSLFSTFFGLIDDEVKELLGVPPRMFLEAAVFLGHGDEKLGRPRRKPLGEVVHMNHWDEMWPGAAEVQV